MKRDHVASRPVMHTRALAAGIIVVAMLGCARGESSDGADSRHARDSAAGPVASASPPPPWYRQDRVLDLTADGRADTVRLDAVGARADSLHISLSIIVGPAVKHREDWSSSYELALADSSRRAGPEADALLRARLDSVLAGVVVQRVGDPGVRLMAEDHTILAGLQPRPTHRISFSYGYETTVRLVWDAPRERFVRLWSCC